jgi:outer membrane protein TolC
MVIRWFIERKHRKLERQHDQQPVAQASHIMLMLVLVPALLGLVNGCKAVGPNYSEPVEQVPTEFANQEQPGMSTAAVEVVWWRGFQDEELNQLVAEALSDNHDIRIATARLREAGSAQLHGIRSLPDRHHTRVYERQRLSKAAARGADRDTEFYHFGFDASWELDFFGRVRRPLKRHRRRGGRRSLASRCARQSPGRGRQ